MEDPLLIGFLSIILMLLLIFIKVPIGLALLIAGTVGFFFITSFDRVLTNVSYILGNRVAVYTLTVIPLFIFMGNLAAEAGIAEDAFLFSYRWFGRISGGLIIASIMACAFFGAVSGSTLAAVAALGRVSVTEMVHKYKYEPSFASGALASAGGLAILIPPSIPLVIYGILAEQSIGKLFIAGIIPGVTLAVLLSVMVFIKVRVNPSLAPLAPTITWVERWKSLPLVIGFAFIFIVVVGGIYTGVFTPTEASAAGALIALLILIIRRRSWPVIWVSLKSSLWQTVQITATLFLIIVGSMVFGMFLSQAGFPQALIELASRLPIPTTVLVFLVMLIYIPLGMVMSSLGMIMVTIPFMVPFVVGLGFDPIWLGILMVVYAEIGVITPPVAMNVYVLAGVVPPDITVEVIFRGTKWYLSVMFLFVIILFAVPQLATWLPSVM